MRGSILDSGSGRHVNAQVTVTDPDAALPLKGFNNTVSWTAGSGSLPISMQDVVSGKQVHLIVDNVDKLAVSNEPILSLANFCAKDLISILLIVATSVRWSRRMAR